MSVKLSSRERHYLTLLSEPGATISIGTSAGRNLHRLGLVEIARWGRYGITPAGRDALQGRALVKPKDTSQRDLFESV